MTEERLNTCSRCGKRPHVNEHFSLRVDEGGYEVECPCGNKTKLYKHRQKAIAKWNETQQNLF